MNLLADAMGGLGVVLLPVAAGLLLEEMTFGGLVRLMLAPRPGTTRRRSRGDQLSSPGCRRKELKNFRSGGSRCSH